MNTYGKQCHFKHHLLWSSSLLPKQSWRFLRTRGGTDFEVYGGNQENVEVTHWAKKEGKVPHRALEFPDQKQEKEEKRLKAYWKGNCLSRDVMAEPQSKTLQKIRRETSSLLTGSLPTEGSFPAIPRREKKWRGVYTHSFWGKKLRSGDKNVYSVF